MFLHDADLTCLGRAREDLRVINLLGRAVAGRCSAYELALVDAEARYEALRDASSAEVVRRGVGLVSIPTSDTRPETPASLTHFERHRSSLLARAASLTVADAVGAFAPDPDAGRIARLRLAVGFTARVHLTDAPGNRVAMVTLTYRDAVKQWERLQISQYIKRCREHFRRRGEAFRYAWVAELQRRGVAGLHYHVAIWLPDGMELPKPDEAGWWPHGFTRIEYARSAPAYLMKYLTKGGKAEDHRLPRGARVHGVGGLGKFWRVARRWCSLPGWIKARCDVAESDQWRRAPGGGWVNRSTGVVVPSEFRMVTCGVSRMLQRVHDHGRPFDAAGVFSWLPGRSLSSAEAAVAVAV